jgi:hypothetical protein
MGLSVQTVAATHAPDHGRGDAFGIRHRFVCVYWHVDAVGRSGRDEAYFFPGVLIQLIGFEGGPTHHLAGESVIEIGLDLLADLAQAFAIEVKLAGESGGTFASGNPTQQHDNRRRTLTGFGKYGASQDGVGALTLSAAIGREVVMPTEEAALCALAAWTYQAEVLLKPCDTHGIIEQLSYGKVNHAGQYTMHT